MEIELQPCEKWKMLMKILSFNLTTFHYACFSFTFPIRILPEAKFSTLSGFTAFISSSRPFREYSAILNVIKYSCYSTRLLKGDLQILHIIFFLFTFEEGKNIEGMCITTDPQDLKEARIKRLQRTPFQSYTPDL